MADFPVTTTDPNSLGDASTAMLGMITPAQAWAIAIASFRTSFPLFVNSAVYTDAQVQMYITFAQNMLRPERWGNLLQMGIFLFVAHMLALDRISSGGKSGIPGTVVGLLSSGSVDKVSYSRDVSSVLEENAGHWNTTTYGLRFIRIARMMGAGPIQVGPFGSSFGGTAGYYTTDPGAYLPQSAMAYDGAWPGVLPGPW